MLLGIVAHNFNPITQVAEAGGSLWVPRQPGLQSEFQDSQGYVENLSQKKKEKKISYFQFPHVKAGKVTQWLKALAILSEVSGSVPSTYMTLHNLCNSSSRGSSALWPFWIPGTHVIHRHTCKQNTPTQINKQIKQFVYVFTCLVAHFFLGLNNIPLSGCTTVHHSVGDFRFSNYE